MSRVRDHVLGSQVVGKLPQPDRRLVLELVQGDRPRGQRLEHMQETHARTERGGEPDGGLRRLLTRGTEIGRQQDGLQHAHGVTSFFPQMCSAGWPGVSG